MYTLLAVRHHVHRPGAARTPRIARSTSHRDRSTPTFKSAARRPI